MLTSIEKCSFVDRLAAWEKRFGPAVPGSWDYQIPSFKDEDLSDLNDELMTAISTSRGMQRYVQGARKRVRDGGEKGVATVLRFARSKDAEEEEIARAFAVYEAPLPPSLISAALQLLDDKRPVLRREAYRILARCGSRHVVPRLLRKLKYEEKLDNFALLCETLAELGSPAPIPHLLQRLRIPEQRKLASTVLIRLVDRFGAEPYSLSDGWSGLEAKARKIWARFAAKGKPLDRVQRKVPPTREGPAPAGASRELTRLADREWWLFLKHLGGTPLRPVDDCRFVGRQLGIAAVPLVLEGLEDSNPYVRVHTIEIARELGPVANACGPALRSLLHDSLCRPYALEALGAVQDEEAARILAVYILHERRPALRVAALKGAARLHTWQPELAEAIRSVSRDPAATVELQVHAAAARMAQAREEAAEARRFLEATLKAGKYHAPTLRELLSK